MDPCSGRRRLQIFGDFGQLAALGNFRECRMDSGTVGRGVFEAMCMSSSGGEEEGKARQHATGDGFGTARWQNNER